MEEDQSNPEAVLGVSEESDGFIRIEKGYNKDHREGCKQLMYGKIVGEHGIPAAGYAMEKRRLNF